MLLSQTFSWKKTSVFKASSLWGHNLNMTQFVEIVQVFWFWLVLKSKNNTGGNGSICVLNLCPLVKEIFCVKDSKRILWGQRSDSASPPAQWGSDPESPPDGQKPQYNPVTLTWLTAALLTDSDLDVISGGRVFEVVDGAQHVQGHVADVVCMKGGLVGNACHHHVGITNRLHLTVSADFQRKRATCCHCCSKNKVCI